MPTAKKSKRDLLLEIYERFKESFPDEAYSEDNSRGFPLTSIKAQYVIERLNEVMGITGWKLEGENRPVDDGILFDGHLVLDFHLYGIDLQHSIPARGFCATKKNTGDMHKSAPTDALSKAASHLGIGNEVFKGNISPHTVKEETVTI